MEQVRVFQFGCLPPIEGREIVEEQLRESRRYYNNLIAVERARRVVYRDLRRKASPDLELLEQEQELRVKALEEAREAINQARQQARARIVDKAQNDEVKRLRDELKNVRARLKEERKRVAENPDFQLEVEVLNERAGILVKALRALTPLFWGTYIEVERAVQQARGATVDPSFRRARGMARVSRPGWGPAPGTIGVQVQGGATMRELLSGHDTRLRLVPVPQRPLSKSALNNPNRKHLGNTRSSRGLRRTVTHHLYFRVGSEGLMRTPVWAVFPIVLQRPLPEDAQVKRCTVSLRVMAEREAWVASFSLVREEAEKAERPGVIAIDLGWRKRPDDSLRVGYWVDDRGRKGELRMPASVRSSLAKARDLQAIESREFDAVRDALHQWCAGVPDTLPAFLESERAYIHKWKSISRLRQLVHIWRDRRFVGDEEIFARLVHWMHRSRHRSQWMERARTKALLSRREVYRRFAAWIAKTYGAVALEDIRLSEVKQHHKPEEKRDAPKPQRLQLHESAPGEFREAIMKAACREQLLAATISAAGTTRTCHVCGASCVWDQAEMIWHRCEHCDAFWDQDENAAWNILRLFQEQFGDAEVRRAARQPKQRVKRFEKKHKKLIDTAPRP